MMADRPTDITPMKPLVTPEMTKIMDQITANIEARPEEERTYQCYACLDHGFIYSDRLDSTGKVTTQWAERCPECGNTPLASPAESKLLLDIPWTLDNGRLCYREGGEPTQWIYPNGKRCAYDGTNRPKYLRRIDPHLFGELSEKARTAKRFAPTGDRPKRW